MLKIHNVDVRLVNVASGLYVGFKVPLNNLILHLNRIIIVTEPIVHRNNSRWFYSLKNRYGINQFLSINCYPTLTWRKSTQIGDTYFPTVLVGYTLICPVLLRQIETVRNLK